jgi:cytidylate kinase
MIIAVDGPAASGKGTIARALAAHFGLPHMDTGLLYRATALNLMEMGGDPDSEFAAARATDLSQIDFNDPQLKSEMVGGIASRISVYPQVRQALLERQQRFAATQGGAVLDGRDIGTVIAPEAGVKLFVTARPEIRARDERDTGRDAAPLVMAKGAILLDTSDMDVNAAIAAAISAAEAASA